MKGVFCLIIPIFCMVCSGFLYFPLNGIFKNLEPEWAKFLLCVLGFLFGSIISFIISRSKKKEN